MPDVTALLTASEAAAVAQVSVQAVGNWRKRGYCLPDGKRVYLRIAGHKNGRPAYTLLDVAKAEWATRKRARR